MAKDAFPLARNLDGIFMNALWTLYRRFIDVPEKRRHMLREQLAPAEKVRGPGSTSVQTLDRIAHAPSGTICGPYQSCMR